MEIIAINAFITVFSCGLFLVSLTSYKRSKNVKILFVSFVFLIFLIKGLLLSFGLIYEDIAEIMTSEYVGFFDLIILLLLFVATLRR